MGPPSLYRACAVGHRELHVASLANKGPFPPANAGADVELSNVAVNMAIEAVRSNALRRVIKSPMVVSGAAFRVALCVNVTTERLPIS